ncbi:hypothetical protein J4204_02340 [Candidatus Woesearchaeota archaeon]|nr:hypothetical protein [Candidatus Woesearchaeota archaeon]
MTTIQSQNRTTAEAFNWLDNIGQVQGSQDINIYVGRRNAYIPSGEQNLDGNKWKKENNLIYFNAKSEGLPYNGLVVKDGTNIYVFGIQTEWIISQKRIWMDYLYLIIYTLMRIPR